MKIKHDTPDLLIAGETPWFIAIMLLFFTLIFVGIGMLVVSEGIWAGLIFVIVGGGLGIGAMGVFVERLQVILDAQAKTLTMRSRTLFQYKEDVIPLENVIRAATESSLSGSHSDDFDKPRQRVSRLVFVLHDGAGTGSTVIQPMTSVMSSGGAAGNVTREINEWLKAHRGVDALLDPEPS
ncbi:hypothetical protein ROA7450_00563 [Roseovarius albus]|uniref:Uncharacterized protein n=1 Tax=Roseovarius albus TaxID=1247867 RepID=A0A1X6YDJ5_9RHOB|nr:hypothetical protein [Roseovarius albus]SLN18038.1 hypothetical protein ROA7450_00563 [Roseovarius albus]